MSTLSIPPKNLLILAALGIGAYWLTTRRALAGQSGANQAARGFLVSPAASANRAQQSKNDADLWKSVGGLLRGVVNQSGSNAAGTYNGTGSSDTGAMSGDPYNPDFSATNPAPGFSEAYDYSKESWY